MTAPRPLREIASEIGRLLKKYEAEEAERRIEKHRRYWMTTSHVSGAKIGVKMISYQGTVYLTRWQAEAYLVALRESPDTAPYDFSNRAPPPDADGKPATYVYVVKENFDGKPEVHRVAYTEVPTGVKLARGYWRAFPKQIMAREAVDFDREAAISRYRRGCLETAAHLKKSAERAEALSQAEVTDAEDDS